MKIVSILAGLLAALVFAAILFLILAPPVDQPPIPEATPDQIGTFDCMPK